MKEYLIDIRRGNMDSNDFDLLARGDYSIFGKMHKPIFRLKSDFSPAKIEIVDEFQPYVNEPRYIDNSGNKLSLLDVIKILNTNISQNDADNNYKDSLANNQISSNKKLLGIPLDKVFDDIVIAQKKGIKINISTNVQNIFNIKYNLQNGEILLNTFDVFLGDEALILKNDHHVYLRDKVVDIGHIFKKFMSSKDQLSRKALGEVCTALKIYELLKENNCENIIDIDDLAIKEIYDYINQGFVYQNTLSNQGMLDFIYAFTKYFARINQIVVQVEFFNSIKDDMGYSDNGIIGLNKNISVVNPHTLYTDTLETIFHEVFHEIQRKEIDINKYTLGNTIERILKENNRSYYGNNYQTILYEVDAKYNSYLILLNYLKDLVPEKYDAYCQEYIEKIEKEIGNYEKNIIGNYNLNNNKYDMDGLRLSRDDALERIIKRNPQVLESMPVLKYIFNPDGTRKDLYELADIVNECTNNKNNDIVDMINYWVRTCSYSLEGIVREYFKIYINGINKLPTEFKDVITISLDEKLFEVILLEISNNVDIFAKIDNILEKYHTVMLQEGILITEFISNMQSKCQQMIEKIDKDNNRKKGLRDSLLGINLGNKNMSILIADDEYLSEKEVAEENIWYRELDNELGMNKDKQIAFCDNEKKR